MKTLMTLVLSALLTIGCSMTGQVQADDDYFSQAELDSMLAPVALYPDSVLSHVLIAATYPLEVIQAARWSREHPGLRGEDAVAAVEHQGWDPSVKALVAFPELLERMDGDLQWTQRLGDAFLMQEEDVIASIQYLRSEAYSEGHLASNDRVKVVREKEYIYIEPARTRTVYVPYYDPRVVYSSWRWSSHPPVYWHRPSGFNLSVSFHWGRPYHVRPNFYFSSFHWAQRRVVVVNHHHHYHRDHRFRSGRDVARFREARHWKHDPKHRRGVSYRGRVEQTRFVDNSRPASARVSSSRAGRASVRSERREWAADRRSSMKINDNARTRSRSNSTSRSDRVADLRGGDRRASGASRAESRNRGSSSRSASTRTGSSRESSRSRTVSGSAPERAASRSRSTESTRSSAERSSRISESLRGSSGSRTSTTSRSRGSERSTGISSSSSSRESGRSNGSRTSRSDEKRSSASVRSGLTVRSSSSRERRSTPSRSTRSSAPSRGASIGRSSSAPSRESAPSRSRSSSSRDSAPSRSTSRVRSSAPSRDSNSSTSSRSSRSSAPSRSSKSSAPSRSRATSTRSSRGSSSSRSRGGDSRRGGRGGEERR